MDKALVLSGGGARGAFQAPVIDSLKKNGFEFDHVLGVSVGSLNGALTSTGCKSLTDVWEQVGRENVLGGSFDFGLMGKLYRITKILLNLEKSFYDNDPLVDLINTYYDPEKTKTSFSFGTVSLKSGRFETFSIEPPRKRNDKDSFGDFEKETLVKYIVASASIPTVFPPVFDEYADGGIKNIAPVASAVESGADKILVVTTENIMNETTSQEDPSNLINIGKISMNIALDEIVKNDYEMTAKINEIVKQAKDKGVSLEKESGEEYREVDLELIQPKRDLGSSLNFSSEIMEERIVAGKRRVEKFLESNQSW